MLRLPHVRWMPSHRTWRRQGRRSDVWLDEVIEQAMSWTGAMPLSRRRRRKKDRLNINEVISDVIESPAAKR